MKNWLFSLVFAFPFFANAQNDTLLFEDFEIDPSAEMIAFPTGSDTVWVNFDEDGKKLVDPFPQNWYSEYGQFLRPDGTKNNVFTSISYLVDANAYNHNWLILPPLKICDSKASIHWKSAPFEGPAYLDGYYLLVSTTENLPEFFKDTLFGAAECTGYPNFNSTDPADFEFSPGYIHANSFTDTSFFMYQFGTNHCKLEPHSYFLNDYEGKTVYLAFLHNSRDDYRLDLDDILVLGTDCSSKTDAPDDFEVAPILYPNPVDWQLNVLFSLKNGSFCQFSVVDEAGKTIFIEPKKWFPPGQNQWNYWPKNLPPEQYFLKIETENGAVSRVFSKI
mgnify:CR=1 FL=1